MSGKEKQPPSHPAVRSSSQPIEIDHPHILKRGDPMPSLSGEKKIDGSNAAEILKDQIAKDKAQGRQIPEGFDTYDEKVIPPPAPIRESEHPAGKTPRKVVKKPATIPRVPASRQTVASEKTFSIPGETSQLPMSDDEYEAAKERLLLEGFTLDTIDKGFKERRKIWREAQGKKKPKSS